MKQKILVILLVLSLIFSVYMGSFESVIFDGKFYKKSFEKNNVYDKIEDADEIGEGLIGFFENKNDLPKEFSENAGLHLVDVKILIMKGKVLLIFLSLLNVVLINLIMFYSRDMLKDISKVFIFSGVFGFIFSLPFVFMAFSNLFKRFHVIFFPQGNYTFNFDSTLIKLFPEVFFQDAFVNVVVSIVIIGFVFILGGIVLSRVGDD